MKIRQNTPWALLILALLSAVPGAPSHAGICRAQRGQLRAVDEAQILLRTEAGAGDRVRLRLPTRAVAPETRARLLREVGKSVSLCIPFQYLKKGGS